MSDSDDEVQFKDLIGVGDDIEVDDVATPPAPPHGGAIPKRPRPANNVATTSNANQDDMANS